jgi:hypothetical protein
VYRALSTVDHTRTETPNTPRPPRSSPPPLRPSLQAIHRSNHPCLQTTSKLCQRALTLLHVSHRTTRTLACGTGCRDSEPRQAWSVRAGPLRSCRREQ